MTISYSRIQSKLDEMNAYSPSIEMVSVCKDDLFTIGVRYSGKESTTDLIVVPTNIMSSDKELHDFLDTTFKCFIDNYGYSLNKNVVKFLESKGYTESLEVYKGKHYAREQ